MRTYRKLSLLTLSLALSAGLVLAGPAYAELNAYMKITGAKQGAFKGSVTQKGREGMIMVIASDHSVATPMDAASGMATGKRQHKPFTITKELDKSSVQLRNALLNNETLGDVVVQYFQPSRLGASGAGAETQYFTITLKNARVTSIHEVMANNRDATQMKLAAYEEVAFTYESITWTWTDGGMTATDSWNSAR